MRLALALILSLVMGMSGAHAADLGGVWKFDQAAWAAQSDKLLAAMLAAIPAKDMADMKAAGIDPEKAYREGLNEPIDGTVEFLPDGKLRAQASGETTMEEGTWKLDGNQLHVEYPNGETRDALEGSVAGDRIVLKPVVTDESSAEAQVLAAVVVTLVRQR